MFTAFTTGLFLGLSLIIAIGAQNAFILRQGILKQHIFFIALFCSISDALLIILGVIGTSFFFNNFIHENSKIIFGLAALWLFSYGVIRLFSALKSNSAIIANNIKPKGLLNALSIAAIFTFANPHVYLDTMILIGSISQQYIDSNKVFFTFGASLASFVWFFGIAYGAKLLSPFMQNPKYWRVLDLFIASVMFTIALNLSYYGGWL